MEIKIAIHPRPTNNVKNRQTQGDPSHSSFPVSWLAGLQCRRKKIKIQKGKMSKRKFSLISFRFLLQDNDRDDSNHYCEHAAPDDLLSGSLARVARLGISVTLRESAPTPTSTAGASRST